MDNLPALRKLGNLADQKPVIVIDSREREPLEFNQLRSVRDGLSTGDYSIRGLEKVFAIERKSIPDLVTCCTNSNRERFERELHRLRGFEFKRLLIVGTDSQLSHTQSRLAPKVVRHTLAAFEARYCPVVWAKNEVKAAALIERWAWWFAREQVKKLNSLLRGSTNPDNNSGAM